MVKTLDIAWTAGFLEGEGTFRITKSNSVNVTAPQKGREMLDRLVSLFGGQVYGPETTKRNIYQWQLNAESAVGLMMTVYSFMSIKRKGEITKALTKWRSLPLRNSKYIEVFGTCKGGHEWIEENIWTEKNGQKRCKSCLQIRSQAYSKQYYIDHKDLIKNKVKLQRLTNKSNNIGI